MTKVKVAPTDELEVLKQQLAEMMAKVAQLSGGTQKDEDDGTKIQIGSDEYIKVMSLCPHELNLSTRDKKKAPFKFIRLYEVKRILYHDLVEIMENHPNFLNEGLFFIMNQDVVRHHGLDEIYERILTKEKMEEVLKGNSTDAVNMFKVANPIQQEAISQKIIQDIVDGKEYDLNFIDRISRVLGEDLDIMKRVKDIKKNTELK